MPNNSGQLSQPPDFYQQLRDKFRGWSANHKWAEYLMFAPDLFHLLCKLAIDKQVPAAEKAKLAVAIAYFVSPLDLIPEALIGPAGYVDDIALAAYVLNSIINTTDRRLVDRYWAGDRDILELVRSILAVADDMIGSGLWQKIRNLI